MSEREIAEMLGRIEGKLDSLKEHFPALVQDAMKDTCEKNSKKLCDKIDKVHEEGEEVEERVGKLERRKRLDTAVSAVGGAVGGALAMMGKALWSR